MDIQDLKAFLVIASCNNLQHAAQELNKTAGALSKVIKRLEGLLNTQLFERQGRNIVLNPNGERFSQYARMIVHEAEQAFSAFGQGPDRIRVNLAGPPVLLQYGLELMATCLPASKFEFNLVSEWEGDALKHLLDGSCHLAFITELAVEQNGSRDLEYVSLGETQFKVAASPEHALFQQYPEGQLDSQQLLDFPFACPSVSPFCGIKKGIGSDGWRDDVVPRNISYRCNDFSTMMALVKQSQAIAYVPDFCIAANGLKAIDVQDCHYINSENLILCYRPSSASGWINRFISDATQYLKRGKPI